jgi:putative DNA primase/helicase
MNSKTFARRIQDAEERENGEWQGLCPTNGHENPRVGEFTWRDGDFGKVIFNCFKGCEPEDVLAALKLTPKDLMLRNVTMEEVAQQKGFTVEYLSSLDVRQQGSSVLIPHKKMDGSLAERHMLRHGSGGPRFTWTPGDGKPVPYGLWRLGEARKQNRLFIVEGPSDCWAAWLHDVPALGLPGATSAGFLEAEHVADLEVLYVVKEPDRGGEALVAGVANRLAELDFSGAARVVQMPDGLKDICALHQKYLSRGPEDRSFNADLETAVYEAAPLELPADPAPALDAGGKAYEQTPVGLSERLVDGYGPDLMFVHGIGWLVYDGRRWKVDAGEYMVSRRCKSVLKDMGREAEQMMRDARDLMQNLSADKDNQARSTLADEESPPTDEPAVAAARKAYARGTVLDEWRKKCSNRAKLTEMRDLAKDDERVLRDSKDLDQQHMLVVVQNGTVNLTTGRLQPSDRGDLITQCAPVSFDEVAECPTFERFMSDIMLGRTDLVAFMQRLLGYCLTGRTDERKFAIFHGLGANGKSTLLEVLRRVMGQEYTRQTPPHTLMVKKGDAGPSPDIARLRGARLVTATESERGSRLAEGIVKSMSGGDMTVARHLYQDYFEFVATHKIVLATNHKPVIAGTGAAIWDRVLLVPFDARFEGEADDKKLKDKLAAELPGILNWLIRGCLEYQRVGLDVPDVVRAANQAYREEQDTLADFWDYAKEQTPPIVLDKRAVISRKEMYDCYAAWAARENLARPMSKKAFGMMLKDLGVRAPLSRERIQRYSMELTKLYWGVGHIPDVPSVPTRVKTSSDEDAVPDAESSIEEASISTGTTGTTGTRSMEEDDASTPSPSSIPSVPRPVRPLRR